MITQKSIACLATLNRLAREWNVAVAALNAAERVQHACNGYRRSALVAEYREAEGRACEAIQAAVLDEEVPE